MKKIFMTCASLCLFSVSAHAWDGYDYDTGSYIEIERNNLVREHEEIEIYDYGTSEYKNVRVESVENSGSSVELEVYDYDAGAYRTFEMSR